jgi:uncharacterized protein
MLVEFSVGNFWSFKEIQTLQMRAAKISSKYSKLDQDNVILVDEQLSLLKSKAIFGANGSGKTSLRLAMSSMRLIIEESVKNMKVLDTCIFPFQLSSETKDKPSFFQVSFVHGDVLFRYGFEATTKVIVSEWLFGKALNAKKGARERFYFTREGNTLDVNETLLKEAKEKQLIASGTNTPPLFRENTLYLTLLATFNVSLARDLYDYIRFRLVPLSVDLDNTEITQLMESPKFQLKVTELLNSIDPSIKDVKLEHGIIWVIRHLKEGNEAKTVPFILFSQEAEGTKRLFTLSPPIFIALEVGSTLFIDEFDAKLHPQLTRKILELFHSPSTNPHNAQLVFITHDSNLLDSHLLRRDQISFAQKDKNGATELYSLAEFKGVRNDASFEKDYLQGKYRAVPTNLNQLEALFENQ